jgi:uncharacterized protein YndB with AHSA1/START domain
MTVTSVLKDPEARTMTITAAFAAPTQRVWQLWEDPRLLERWWGPPTFPATVVDHDLSPGGRVTYYMTGPDGDQPRGWWRVIAAEPPGYLEFEDGFADAQGNPDPTMPTMTVRVTVQGQPDGGTRMTVATTFPSVEAMDQMVAMGMQEGMTAAIEQMDDLLRADATHL